MSTWVVSGSIVKTSEKRLTSLQGPVPNAVTIWRFHCISVALYAYDYPSLIQIHYIQYDTAMIKDSTNSMKILIYS